jgi:hypothetical protein
MLLQNLLLSVTDVTSSCLLKFAQFLNTKKWSNEIRILAIR